MKSLHTCADNQGLFLLNKWVCLSVLRRWISSGRRVQLFSAMTGSASPWFIHRPVSHPSPSLLKADVSVAQLITSGLIRHHYCNPISALYLPHKHGRTHSKAFNICFRSSLLPSTLFSLLVWLVVSSLILPRNTKAMTWTSMFLSSPYYSSSSTLAG